MTEGRHERELMITNENLRGEVERLKKASFDYENYAEVLEQRNQFRAEVEALKKENEEMRHWIGARM